MRILGIDYGDRRIGLSLSDPLMMIASPLSTYQRKGDAADLEFFKTLCVEKEVTKAVVGLPKNMNGTEGERAQIARDFGAAIAEFCGIDVVFRDERLSSVSANRILDEAEMHWSKRKKVVDTIAAQIILQTYLDAGGR